MSKELTHELDVKLMGGMVLKLSVFKKGLLFLHSDFISAQFQLDTTGINVQDNLNCAKIEFYVLNKVNRTDADFEDYVGDTYQSWYVEHGELETLRNYFRSLGFRCEQIPMFRAN